MAAGSELPMRLRRLLPEPGSLTADEALEQLRFAECASDARPFVAVNMVATVDGRASVDGRTAALSSVADRQFFHALRTCVDGVLVGAGTLRTERYGRLVRAAHRRDQRVANGLTPDPLAIVVSGSLDLPATLPLLQGSHHASSSSPPPKRRWRAARRTSSICVRPRSISPQRSRACAASTGMHSILCEGGPSLNTSLLAAGLLDELFLTIAPKLAGGSGALSTPAHPPRSRRPADPQLTCEERFEQLDRYGAPELAVVERTTASCPGVRARLVSRVVCRDDHDSLREPIHRP
jgi:riboflavin biosynthesis pyrimidine reductase